MNVAFYNIFFNKCVLLSSFEWGKKWFVEYFEGEGEGSTFNLERSNVLGLFGASFLGAGFAKCYDSDGRLAILALEKKYILTELTLDFYVTKGT